MVNAILTTSPPRRGSENPDCPVDLETIILKAIAKEPRDRYASAAALADDLDRFLAGQPILARRPGLLRRSWSWSRRNPWKAAVLTGP